MQCDLQRKLAKDMNLHYISPPGCSKHAYNGQGVHLRNHPYVYPAIQLSAYLRIPVPIPPWSIILNVNINNLTPTERSQADPTLLQVANGYFIYRIAYYSSFSSPHSVMLSLAVPLSSDSPLYTLLFCFPNGFSIFLWLQKPPNYGGPLAFITIFKLLVHCSPPFFSSAVLASFANFSFAIHDLLTLFAADYITWILYKLVKF